MQEHSAAPQPLPSPKSAQEMANELPSKEGNENSPTAQVAETGGGATEPAQEVPDSTVETSDSTFLEESVQKAPEADSELIQEAPEIYSDQELVPGGDDAVSPQTDDEEPLPGDDKDNPQESVPASGAPEFTSSVREYEEIMNRHPLFLCLTSLGCGCCARSPKRWPRTFWFLFGVVVPLWILIAIAGICGIGLAKLEAPNEITSNDEKLETKYQIDAVDNMTKQVVSASPSSLCLHLYVANKTFPEEVGLLSVDVETEGFYQAAVLFEATLLEMLDVGTVLDIEYNETVTFNTTELLNFMASCGKMMEGYISQIQSATSAFSAQQGDLTFNWDRCVNTSDVDGRITIDLPFTGETTYDALQPEAQASYYEEIWLIDMNRIYSEVYNKTLPDDPTKRQSLETQLFAFQQATEEATGEDACVHNIPASAWFFFTVMTTIGYGNQAPTSSGGQAMIYTLGFLSILAFAATAASAGYIMTSLFDDIMKKSKLGFLSPSPLAASVFWGVLYYSWLILISSLVEDWKESRLGEEQDFARGYWFAYISTTTIGLGDIYLEPEVLMTQDLLIFSLVFLIGFVFLASFLGSLGSFIKGVENIGGKTLPENLAATTICCCHKVAKAGYHVGEELVKGGYHLGEEVVKGGYHAGHNFSIVGHAVMASGKEMVMKKGLHHHKEDHHHKKVDPTTSADAS